MNLAEKERTSKLAEYCLRCFAPKVFPRNTPDCNEDCQHECYVSSTNKHKYSCLTKTCLKHSWICEDHIDENKPLRDAHYWDFDSIDQHITVPTNSIAHTLNHPHTVYPSTIGIDITQPIRAVSPLIVSPTAQKTGTIENSTEEGESQALTVPEQVGGHINVLLETHYSPHFPKPMHILENRLGTYKVKLLC